jgi:hypothetical protein
MADLIIPPSILARADKVIVHKADATTARRDVSF